MENTELELAVCEACGHRCESDGRPVTVGGWHGDICYGWGRHAGVYLCLATRYRCPECSAEWPAEPDWDRGVR